MSTPTTMPQADAAKTDALIAADKAALPNMDNVLKARADAMQEARDMGERAAEGAGSLLELALWFVDKVRDRVLSVGSGKSAAGDDAEQTYVAYAMAYNAKGVLGVEALPTDAKDGAKNSVSIFRTFGLAAPYVPVTSFYRDRVTPLFKAIPSDERAAKSLYNSLVKLNRELVKGELNAATSPVVTDEWITSILTAKPKADKTALDKLKPAIDQIAHAHKTGAHPWLEVVGPALIEAFSKAMAEQAAQEKADAAGTVH